MRLTTINELAGFTCGAYHRGTAEPRQYVVIPSGAALEVTGTYSSNVVSVRFEGRIYLFARDVVLRAAGRERFDGIALSAAAGR